MTLLNPVNGMLVNTTLINAGTPQLGAVNADVIVDLLTQGNVITTTNVTVKAIAEFLADSTVRLQSNTAPMWAEVSMYNRDIEHVNPVTDVGTSIVSRVIMDDLPFDIIIRGVLIEAVTDMEAMQTVGKIGVTSIEAIAESKPWANVISENATVIEANHEWPVVDVIIKVGDAIKLDDCNCDCPVYGPNLTFPPEGCSINENQIFKQCVDHTV